MDKYIGFDIDSKKTVACVVQKGKKEVYATMSSDVRLMRNFLKAQKADGSRVHLTFEVSGQAGFLYDSLTDCADTITVSNPSKMTWIYRTAIKNDRIGARKQAVLLSIGEIPRVHMPSVEVRQWRGVILHRRNLVNKVTEAKNRIRAVLKSQGFSRPFQKGGWWKRSNRLWMCELCGQRIVSMELWRMNLGNLIEQLDLLEGQVKRVSKYLDEYLGRQAGGRLLMSVPGVGPRTAEAVLAYTDDVDRFGNTRGYCSYFGLTPRLDESGTSRRLGHISKTGPSVVRWLLCESGWKVIRKSGAMRGFYERVKCGQENRKKIAIIAVCRRLLAIMRAMLRTGELYNEKLVGRECWNNETVKAS